jgi:ribonuclease P protein component
MNQTLKKSELIGRSQELRRLFVAQYRILGETVSIRYGKAQKRRVAFITRGIKKAVERNRARRQLKEIYRQNKDCFPENYEYLFIAQPQMLHKEFSALRTEVLDLARRVVHA